MQSRKRKEAYDLTDEGQPKKKLRNHPSRVLKKITQKPKSPVNIGILMSIPR